MPGDGLLSEIVLLDTVAGAIAVKRPTSRPSGIDWLDSRRAMRHEAAFYLAARTAETGDMLPRVIAVAPGAGVVVMDMRADNILARGERIVFIDWQLAARAPGGMDLAGLLATSAAAPTEGVDEVVHRYAEAAGIETGEARDGFLRGLVVRAAFAVPVITRLPHPTARSRELRRKAVERLGLLLEAHAAELG